ncbi:hypothetical protein L1987_23107 [Smallanthus sonchifolius]|uniref:Uncharacterized protein n=1 Tax=Smallanthus sonchifolius TaxID=185202 RepID=A0ACB9II26_9ASTR|nr:hypothetical protein L1987_23107 [Smallanthus sonchifolius]
MLICIDFMVSSWLSNLLFISWRQELSYRAAGMRQTRDVVGQMLGIKQQQASGEERSNRSDRSSSIVVKIK